MTLLAQASDDQNLVWQLQSQWPWSPWFTVVFVVVVVMGVAYLYARESSPAGPAYRALLAVLRLTTFALVLLMLSELLLAATRNGLPRLIVLVDHSASMGLEQPADSADGSGRSRLEAARDLLVNNDAELLRKLQDQYHLEVVAVADGSMQLDGDSPEQLAEQLLDLNTEGPTAAYSRLGDGVMSVVDSPGGVPPAGVILATDGRTTAGRSLDEAAAHARQRGVPVYTIGYGTKSTPPNLQIGNLLADRKAFVGDLVAINVRLEARGIDEESAMVRVRDTATGEVTAEQMVDIAGSPFTKRLQLIVQPKRKGQATYEVNVEAIADERDTTDNTLQHTIEVTDDQVRVLLAAGYPSYEFRYLKNLLERDSSFVLHSYLQEADVDYVQQDATAIAQLPMEVDGLDDTDVVVLMDLNPRLLPPRWWQNVERHVVDQGGGLVLVAGPRYFPWQYASTPAIGTLSPVEGQSAGRVGGVYDPGFRLVLTPLASGNAAMQLGQTAQESLSIWQGLPPFYWYVAGEVKPAARVLATHPSARATDGNLVPLVASQFVGSGRVVYHGVDSTWRWRYRVGEVFFARYWGQMLRRLARSKLLDEGEQAELLVERDQYDLGQPVRLLLRANGKTIAEQGELELLLSAPGQASRRVTLRPSRASPDLLQATLTNLAPGKYRATVASSEQAGVFDPVEFSVVAPPDELADITMNQSGLENLSSSTYGKFYTAQNAQAIVDDLPKGQKVPLEVLPPLEIWNQWWILAAITACLTTEWILRKRQAML